MLFWKAIKTAFNYSSMPYSLYLAFGFFISQLLNILVYKARGAKKLQTWFNWIFGIYYPSVEVVEFLCLIMALFVFFLCQFLLPKIRSYTSEQMLTRGILMSIMFCIISQLIFSSVMRLSYEFSFCLIVFTGLIVCRVFIQPIQGELSQNLKLYQELCDLLKILIPICIGFPILMGGGGFIASFYKEEQEFLKIQLYRHIAMALYFEIGAALFLLLPILKKILYMRGNL